MFVYNLYSGVDFRGEKFLREIFFAGTFFADREKITKIWTRNNLRPIYTTENFWRSWDILVPRATRLFLNYVSCSSGNGQKIYFFWLADSNCMRNNVKIFGFYA